MKGFRKTLVMIFVGGLLCFLIVFGLLNYHLQFDPYTWMNINEESTVSNALWNDRKWNYVYSSVFFVVISAISGALLIVDYVSKKWK